MSVDIENLKKEIDVLKDNEKNQYIEIMFNTICEVRYLTGQFQNVLEDRLEEISKRKPIK